MGSALGLAWWGAIMGTAGGLLAALARASAQQRALSHWLRGPMVDQPPSLTGLWAETAYRVERGLREREAQTEQERIRLQDFLLAIEASPNGVLLLDANEQIEWLNPTAALHLGLDRSRDRRQRITNLVRAPAFVGYLQRGQFGEAVVMSSPDGRGTLMLLARRYGQGMKLVLTQDITERERADAMRREFVANVSHEIRTPLTVVAGFLETMTDLPLSETERRRVLEMMTQQTERMQSLVADLLTLARLEGSPRPPVDRWLSVTDLLVRVGADAEMVSSGRHSLQIAQAGEAELAGVESELLSAIGNLAHNAIRYTPTGGRVTVDWRWRSDGGAEVVVIDTGPGIAREHLPRLTERFYRVDGSRSRETGGTGLGLSIVKHVVQRHGGDIAIDSEPGKGSVFRLLFPPQRVRRRSRTAAESLTA